MQKALVKLNETREALIGVEHKKAVADLKLQMINNPLATEYQVYSGCINQDVTNEIARRFRKDGFNAQGKWGGLFNATYYLHISIRLLMDDPTVAILPKKEPFAVVDCVYKPEPKLIPVVSTCVGATGATKSSGATGPSGPIFSACSSPTTSCGTIVKDSISKEDTSLTIDYVFLRDSNTLLFKIRNNSSSVDVDFLHINFPHFAINKEDSKIPTSLMWVGHKFLTSICQSIVKSKEVIECQIKLNEYTPGYFDIGYSYGHDEIDSSSVRGTGIINVFLPY